MSYEKKKQDSINYSIPVDSPYSLMPIDSISEIQHNECAAATNLYAVTHISNSDSMVNDDQLRILLQGAEAWNKRKEENRGNSVDLSGANLSGADLCGANLSGANLTGAHLNFAYFNGANLYRANLSGAYLGFADLRSYLAGAILRGAHLYAANLNRACLKDADLSGADLSLATLVETNLEKATLTGCKIYGISAWELKLEDAKQNDLVITPPNEPVITVDNLEVAQFIYLLLHNEKIRGVIDTIARKAVLILGRFTPPERKAVLDALREELRKRGYLPILFDFEKPSSRDFTETIRILAGMSLFVIADISNPKSSPLELQATVPDYMIPFVPMIQEGEEPFAMFNDLRIKYDKWFLDTRKYDSCDSLIRNLDKAIINPALKVHRKLVEEKAREQICVNVEDVEDDFADEVNPAIGL